ncbi:MAG: type II toxin-antitoxin system YafQ family toxin [Alphaproteobacteria bacterium]|nr:type II toxin-antitoxin system YafQ family toxin [Alphaproteobacteria bacterium]
MKSVVQSSAFERDLKKMKKRGKDLSKLLAIVECLAKGEALSAKHKQHPLKGDWHPKWDCHIEPDWLLIYEVTKDTVKLARTGTHSDLF